MKSIDILEYLPRVAMAEHMRGDAVYAPGNRSLHLVVNGIVKVYRQTVRGSLLIDLYGADEIFGESGMAGGPKCEYAHAFTDLLTMSWTFERIDQLCMEKPEIGIALLRLFAVRQAGFADRIESLALDSLHMRLAKTLLRFSDRMGSALMEGGTLLPHLTHDLLSGYVGTTRENVTKCVQGLRKLGLIRSYGWAGSSRCLVVMGSLREFVEGKKEVAA